MYVRYIHLPPMRQSIYMNLAAMVIHWNIFFSHHLFPPGSVPGLIKTHHKGSAQNMRPRTDGGRTARGLRAASLRACSCGLRGAASLCKCETCGPTMSDFKQQFKMATISATGQGSQVSPLMRGTIHGLTESPPTSNSKYLLGVTQ